MSQISVSWLMAVITERMRTKTAIYPVAVLSLFNIFSRLNLIAYSASNPLSDQKSETRVFPKSTTAMRPSGVMQMPQGLSNSPGPGPLVPNFFRKTPEEENT